MSHAAIQDDCGALNVRTFVADEQFDDVSNVCRPAEPPEFKLRPEVIVCIVA
jgi:hypothetical protein